MTRARSLLLALAALAAVGAGAYALGGLEAPWAAAPTPAKKMFVTGVLSGVTVVDLASGKEVRRIETGLLPHNLLLSPDGKRVFVSNVGSQSISVIDVATLEKQKDILVGTVPDNPAHAAYERRHPGKLAQATSCFGCHTHRAVGTLPNAMTWAPDGRHLMVNEVRPRRVAWLDVEAGTTPRQVSFELPTPAAPANMFVHPRSKEVWVVHRFEPEEHKGARRAKGPGVMGGFDHDPPAGQHISWVTVHDPAMTRELARIRMELAVAFDGAFSPDGRWFYAAYRSSNQIAVFDTATRQLARTVTTCVSPVGLALSPDGATMFVTCLFSNPAVVQAIDIASGEITVSMGVPPSPSLVVQDPATGFLYVTATGSNVVLEIDPKGPRLLRKLPAGHQPLDVLLTS